MRSKPVIAFAGISHLSLVYAVTFASFASTTIVYDPDNQKKIAIEEGTLPIDEPGLYSGLFDPGKKIEFTTDINQLSKAQIIFIAKDIQTDSKNNSKYEEIERLLRDLILNNLSKIPTVIMSQVQPGFCRKWAKEFDDLTYFVETLIFGIAISRAENPERLILGKDHQDSLLSIDFRTILENFRCPILETKYESAELAKISINLYLAGSVTLSNHVSEMAKKIGADWDFVSACLRTDQRIGKYAYLNPGLGLSGGNIERDIRNFEKLSKQHDNNYGLMALWNEINYKNKIWPSKCIKNAIKIDPNSKIGFLGIAYKSRTNSIKNAPSVVNANNLKCRIFAHDPMVHEDDFPNNIVRCTDIKEVINGCDAVVIFNDSLDYISLKPTDFKSMKGNLVIDPMGILKTEFINDKKFNYMKL